MNEPRTLGFSSPEDLADRIAQLEDEVTALSRWRDLALQFDNHRMAALWHLKMLVNDYGSVKDARAFLSKPPLAAHEVVAERDELREEVERLTEEASLPEAKDWEYIDSGDLDDAEAFITSRLKGSMFFPVDAYTLANISMHCIREVRATRTGLDEARELLAHARPDNAAPVAVHAAWFSRRDAFLSLKFASAGKCQICGGAGLLREPGSDPGDCRACNGTGNRISENRQTCGH